METQNRILIFAIALLSVIGVVRGAAYEFIFDNDEIFDNCPEIPGNNGMHDMFNLTELRIEFVEGRINIDGNATCAWEGVEPSDRIRLHQELYKFRHGAWQMTPFSNTINDFCKVQFDPTTIWYQVWSKHIPENERLCGNNYGHTYHYNPFSVDTVFDFVINMEGRHKIVGYVEAFDRSNVKRPKTMCSQIFGEFVKVK